MKKPKGRRPGAPAWLRRTLWGGVGVGVIGALVLALRPQPVAVDLRPAIRGALEVAVEEDGRTRVRHRHRVIAPVAGTLLRPELEAGDPVAPGSVVAQLMGPEAPIADARTEAQLEVRRSAARSGITRAEALAEAARAGVAEARELLRTQEVLLAGGGGSRSAVERAEALASARDAELRSALAMIEMARSELRDIELALDGGWAATGGSLSLLSPMEGIVLRRLRDSAGAVAPGEPLLEIGDPNDLEVVVDVLSADATRIEPGAPATLAGWGGDGDAALEAVVRRVEPAGFTRLSALGIEEQRVSVILAPTRPGAWRGLGDGFRVEARILVERIDETLKVPAGAIFRRGDGWSVFRVEGRRLREVPVEVGRRTSTEAEILSGLAEGDPVVVYPSDRVTDGRRFTPRS
jgi:HlyD family secretion protein